MELQRAVISCILRFGNKILEKVESILKDDFFEKEYFEIYRSIRKLYEAGNPIDVITVSTDLSKGDLALRIKPSFLIGIAAESFAVPERIEFYVEGLREIYTRKQLVKNAEIMAKDPQKIGELLPVMNSLISGDKNEKMFQDWKLTIKEIEYRYAHKGMPGLKTGFDKIDEILLGLRKGNYYLLAGRPSTGKTALALNIATHLIDKSHSVLFISFEQTWEEMGIRLLSSATGIDSRRIQSGYLEEENFDGLAKALIYYESKPLYFAYYGGLSIDDLYRDIKETLVHHKIEVIFMDYIQLISGIGESRQQQVAYISRKFKTIAMEFNIPVVVVSQLSRAIEKRGDKSRPRLSDLRDSGSLEQDADVVLFLHRSIKGQYSLDENEIVDVIVAKNRHGSTGLFNLNFKKKCVRFEDEILF